MGAAAALSSPATFLTNLGDPGGIVNQGQPDPRQPAPFGLKRERRGEEDGTWESGSVSLADLNWTTASAS